MKLSGQLNNKINDFGFSERDMNTIFIIFEKYTEITEVWLFGSRALGNFKPGSDIDFAIMNNGVPDNIITRLLADFEDSSLPWFVDIVNFTTLKNPQLIEHININGKPFYLRNNKNSENAG